MRVTRGLGVQENTVCVWPSKSGFKMCQPKIATMLFGSSIPVDPECTLGCLHLGCDIPSLLLGIQRALYAPLS